MVAGRAFKKRKMRTGRQVRGQWSDHWPHVIREPEQRQGRRRSIRGDRDKGEGDVEDDRDA